MKFKKKVKQEPEIGSLKEDIRFAFLPTRMSNDDIVWLEPYTISKKYGFINKWNYVKECWYHVNRWKTYAKTAI